MMYFGQNISLSWMTAAWVASSSFSLAVCPWAKKFLFLWRCQRERVERGRRHLNIIILKHFFADFLVMLKCCIMFVALPDSPSPSPGPGEAGSFSFLCSRQVLSACLLHHETMLLVTGTGSFSLSPFKFPGPKAMVGKGKEVAQK